MRELLKAMGEGKRCWATVLRRSGVVMVRGEDVKDGELLSWTYEGAQRWRTEYRVVWERIGTAEHFLGQSGFEDPTQQA